MNAAVPGWTLCGFPMQQYQSVSRILNNTVSMNNSKIYVVANPGLKLNLLRAELADDSIKTSISKDGINQRDLKEFLYSDISRVNISLIDINRNQISIEFSSGKKLKLISLSLGKLENGKLHRDTVNQAVEFNEWISEFHKILVEKKMVNGIEFSEGSTAKILILFFIISICIIGMIFAGSIGKIGIVATLLTGAIGAGALLIKMGTKKRYDPESKISR